MFITHHSSFITYHPFLLALMLLLPALSFARNDDEAVLRAQMGDSAYRAGNYEEAATVYEDILAGGLTSADLYYNLGNTYYRLEQYGPAILNYERALRLSPTMGDARENLALANSHTADRITQLPRLFVVNWYIALITRLSPAAWRTITLIFFLLGLAAVVAITLSRNITLRKTALATAIVSGLLFVVSLILMFASISHFNSHSEAIVMQPSIAVKSSPENQSADKLILHEGTKVTISESLSGWYKITLSDGTTGWCQENTIERI